MKSARKQSTYLSIIILFSFLCLLNCKNIAKNTMMPKALICSTINQGNDDLDAKVLVAGNYYYYSISADVVLNADLISFQFEEEFIQISNINDKGKTLYYLLGAKSVSPSLNIQISYNNLFYAKDSFSIIDGYVDKNNFKQIGFSRISCFSPTLDNHPLGTIRIAKNMEEFDSILLNHSIVNGPKTDPDYFNNNYFVYVVSKYGQTKIKGIFKKNNILYISTYSFVFPEPEIPEPHYATYSITINKDLCSNNVSEMRIFMSGDCYDE